MFAKFFIEHPVLANVIALVIMLLGGVAVFLLPVSEYPPITPPTVQVTTSYPGASAKTLVETVALPIEQQVNGVENMLYMQSQLHRRWPLHIDDHVSSRDRSGFRASPSAKSRLGGDRTIANGSAAAGCRHEKEETSPLQIITLSPKDDRYSALFLSNFATLQLRDKLARVEGVGDVMSSESANTACGSGLIPASLISAGPCRRMLSNAIQHKTLMSPRANSACRLRRSGEEFQLTAK